MPKSYSPEYIKSLNQVRMYDNLGIALARACIKANLPIVSVAKLMGVSRMTIHTWFRGGVMSPKSAEMAKTLLKVIEVDTARGVLPLADLKSARTYVKEFFKAEKESA